MKYLIGLAAALAFADAALYLILISRDDGPNDWVMVAVLVVPSALAGVLATVSLLVSSQGREALLLAASTILLAVGVLGIFLPLLVAGALTLIGAATARRGRRRPQRPAPPLPSASSRL